MTGEKESLPAIGEKTQQDKSKMLAWMGVCQGLKEGTKLKGTERLGKQTLLGGGTSRFLRTLGEFTGKGPLR